MNNEEKYNILQIALRQYFNTKIQNLNREDMDIFTANDVYNEYKEIKDWLLEWYEELEPYDISPKSKMKVKK